MDIPKAFYLIVENNSESLKEYYLTHKANLDELNLVASLFFHKQFKASIQTVKAVWNACYESAQTDKDKKNFLNLSSVSFAKNLDFLDYMKNENGFIDLLKQFYVEISESLDKKLIIASNPDDLDKKTIQKIEQIKTIIENIKDKQPVKNEDFLISNIASDLRLKDVDLNDPHHEKIFDKDLVLKVFENCIQNNCSLDKVESILVKAKEIRKVFLEQSDQKNYSCFASYINNDIVASLTMPGWDIENSTAQNLWQDCEKYSLETIRNAILKKPIGKKEILEKTYQAIWVLTSSGDVVLGKAYSDNPKGRMTHHIDLASGESIVSGGIILFSQDMRKIVAINNGSGHYKPNIESVESITKYLKKSSFDVSDSVICDIDWNACKKLSQDLKESLKVPQKDQVLSKMISFRESNKYSTNSNFSLITLNKM